MADVLFSLIVLIFLGGIIYIFAPKQDDHVDTWHDTSIEDDYIHLKRTNRIIKNKIDHFKF